MSMVPEEILSKSLSAKKNEGEKMQENERSSFSIAFFSPLWDRSPKFPGVKILSGNWVAPNAFPTHICLGDPFLRPRFRTFPGKTPFPILTLYDSVRKGGRTTRIPTQICLGDPFFGQQFRTKPYVWPIFWNGNLYYVSLSPLRGFFLGTILQTFRFGVLTESLFSRFSFRASQKWSQVVFRLF